MYCVKCGVKLADSQEKCPLCGTEVIVPKGEVRITEPSRYPSFPGAVHDGLSRFGIAVVLTTVFVLLAGCCLACDLGVNRRVIFSDYVMLTLAFFYILLVFPLWFKKIPAVITVPIDFTALSGLLLYINGATGGNWYLSLAFPLTGILGILFTVISALICYTGISHGYIWGGGSILLGGLMMLFELFVKITFSLPKMFVWSLYPCSAFFLLGCFFIGIAVSPSLKREVKRRFFF